jgi:Tfp pilus assembly protein PilF
MALDAATASLERRGHAAWARGAFQEAADAFRQATERAPEHATLHYKLGAALSQAGDHAAAALAFEASLAVEPGMGQAHLQLGRTLARLGAPRAVEHLRQAMALTDDPDVLTDVSAAAHAANHTELAREAVRAALTIAPLHPRAAVQLATVERTAGEHDNAIQRVLALLGRPHPQAVQVDALTELAFALDGAGRYAEAFDAFSTRNLLVSQTPAAQRLDAKAYTRSLRSIAAAVQGGLPPARPPADRGPVPAFLVGFPRSGTTLSEQILASHPAVRSMDEEPVLAALIASTPTVLGRSIAYPAGLGSLSTSERATLRDAYRAQAGLKEEGLTLDKMPLNLAHLPFLRAVFPDSKVLLLLRDPRDCCLSAWMQDFVLNEAMVQFLDLARTGATYRAVMDVWLATRSTMGEQVHIVRYEALTADPRTQIEGMLAHLGLPWDDATLRHDERARQRFISTPSRNAVSQPIHRRAVARWRHYEAHLEPLVGALGDVLEQLDYPR